jgi:hypothetical protein
MKPFRLTSRVVGQAGTNTYGDNPVEIIRKELNYNFTTTSKKFFMMICTLNGTTQQDLKQVTSCNKH